MSSAGGLRSLWDMINFEFTEAHAALELLNYEYRDALQKSLESRKAVVVQRDVRTGLESKLMTEDPCRKQIEGEVSRRSERSRKAKAKRA